MLEEEAPFPEHRLRGVFEELGQACKYVINVCSLSRMTGYRRCR